MAQSSALVRRSSVHKRRFLRNHQRRINAKSCGQLAIHQSPDFVVAVVFVVVSVVCFFKIIFEGFYPVFIRMEQHGSETFLMRFLVMLEYWR